MTRVTSTCHPEHQDHPDTKLTLSSSFFFAGIDPAELEISIDSGDERDDEFGELDDDDASLLDALEGSSSEYETDEDA